MLTNSTALEYITFLPVNLCTSRSVGGQPGTFGYMSMTAITRRTMFSVALMLQIVITGGAGQGAGHVLSGRLRKVIWRLKNFFCIEADINASIEHTTLVKVSTGILFRIH